MRLTKGSAVILLSATAILFLAGCSEYSKLLKTQDNDLKYRKAIDYYKAKKYQKTIQLMSDVSHFYTGSEREDSVAYYSGAAFYKSGDWETSSIIFDEFRRKFGRSPFIEDVEYMYAMGFYYSSPAPERDQTMTQRAMVSIREYLDRYPNSTQKEQMNGYLKELQQKLYDKSYVNAKTYYKIHKYKSAVVAIKNALAQYPETTHREELMYLIAKSRYLLAYHSIEELQTDRYLDMMDAYYNFVAEFPDSKYGKELDKMMANAKEHIAKTKTEEE